MQAPEGVQAMLKLASLGADFSDRGRLFLADRGRRFSAIVDAQGMRASEGVHCISIVHDQFETHVREAIDHVFCKGHCADLSTAADGACDVPADAVDKSSSSPCSSQVRAMFIASVPLRAATCP